MWVRWPKPAGSNDERPILAMTAVPRGMARAGPLRVLGAWQLASPNRYFGSYSALVSLGDGTLLAASDSGRRLRFTPPGRHGPGPRFDYFAAPEFGEKRSADIEAMTRDPVTGQLWTALEWNNRIDRYDRDLRLERRVQPAAMRRWRANTGAEAMVRLADGRFVVLAEAGERWFGDEGPGLLFPADPTEAAAPLRFRFRPPAGYSPVDLAALPDGRVLILLRRVLWGVPPHFAGKLMVAHPSTIRAGQAWHAAPLADLAAPLPVDNYEGLAIEAGSDGGLVLWLIADSNHTVFQRTLLLKLGWPATQKAREGPRAP